MPRQFKKRKGKDVFKKNKLKIVTENVTVFRKFERRKDQQLLFVFA